MREITLEELLEAGCHFGHQVTRGNPKARDYIFEARDNIHIIDLAKTKAGLEEAGKFIFNLAAKNGSLIVVGTKRQAQGIVEEEVKRSKHTKKEVGLWEKEKQKLQRLYGGISDLKKIPDAVFVIDSHLEDLVIDEAGKMGVATVAIVDTNANPEAVDYPIPANDDATGSIKLITNYIIDAWIEGKNKAKESAEKQEKEAGKSPAPI